jgi:hypothetical protein
MDREKYLERIHVYFNLNNPKDGFNLYGLKTDIYDFLILPLKEEIEILNEEIEFLKKNSEGV